MKINTVLSHDAEYIGDIQENRVGIDKSNLDFITTLLTSNLYSKPLESFFRETVANAYDSHIEAGTEEPILLLIEDTKAYKTYRISIRDYGTGVSPERFEKIYRNIGSSTKRESNDYIGMFGIGRFSCLSCADVAHITSYYKGVKYSYIMYKNGGGINIDKISTSNGDYKDGLEVSIEKYINDLDFRDAINGLCLFDKVYITYKGENYYLKSVINNFNERKVVHYKNFVCCSTLRASTNYFKVGNVLYPGEIKDLDTQGLVVELPIGSVDITPNREALQYTDFTNTTIKNQVALVKQELQDLVNAEVAGNLTLEQFYKGFISESTFVVKLNDDSPELRISRDDVKLDTSKLVIDKEPLPNGYVDFLSEIKYFEISKEFIHKTVNKDIYQRRFYNLEIRDFISGRTALIEKLDKVTKQVTMQYTLDNLSKSAVILCYEGLEKLKSAISQFLHNRVTPINADVKACVDFTFRHVPIKTISNAAVPQSYISSYREQQKGKKKKIDNSEIPIRIYTSYGYRQGVLSQLPKKGLIVYTAHLGPDDTNSELRELSSLLYYTDSVAAVITIKKDYMKLIESNKRYVTVENFLYMKNKILSKFVTSCIIAENFSSVFETFPIYKYNIPNNIPITQEYLKKYSREHKMREARHSTTSQNIIKYYKDRDWVNKTDIEYFKLTDKEVSALNEWRVLQEHRYEIVRMVAFKKFGRMPKIGLTPIIAPIIP